MKADDFVIADWRLCGEFPGDVGEWGPDRQRTPRPYLAGEMAQTVHVARDAEDAGRLADLAPRGRRVVVLDFGGNWTLPRPFGRAGAGVVSVSVRPPGPDRIASRSKDRD